jgi:hypothetical protein
LDEFPRASAVTATHIVLSPASHIVFFHEVFMARLWASWAGISMHCAWNAPDIKVAEQVVQRTGFN